ncbi:hypothetical protein [Streptomyces sp. URMC 123]|uniref:hypothetical protein n=1 Tax=Streptomyces sp. URMC 123 TaxID=3423403 RepID=UPI003F1C318A
MPGLQRGLIANRLSYNPPTARPHPHHAQHRRPRGRPRAAYARAGVAPDAVGYVELHHTGIPVGDPVEAAALNAVFGTARIAPLPVGSVKTNIGSGTSCRPSLNFRSAPAGVPLERLNLRVETEATPLGGGGFVGVSSFGMSFGRGGVEPLCR